MFLISFCYRIKSRITSLYSSIILMGFVIIMAQTYLTSPDPNKLFIKENTRERIDHDQLFKKLIKTFFKEFLEAFFPNIYHQIDFTKVTYLSEEVFTNSYDGDKKVLDLVVEVKWRETDALVIVHIEPQSYYQSDFNKRMFEYFSLLYNKVKKPIIPIAIFSYNAAWDKNEFTMKFSDIEVLRFNYLTLHLRKQNWREFLQQDNAAAA